MANGYYESEMSWLALRFIDLPAMLVAEWFAEMSIWPDSFSPETSNVFYLIWFGLLGGLQWWLLSYFGVRAVQARRARIRASAVP